MAIRLDKFLSEMGAGTRSEVKKYIRAGLVTVDGIPAKKPELKIDEQQTKVCFRGKELSYVAYEYYLFYKPAGCVSATEDNLHKTVMDYLTDVRRKDLFPVGRLDIDTEGLLFITNDGALAHELLSPAKHVEKTYYAKVEGHVTEDDVNLFKKGVDIGEDVPTKPAKLVVLSEGDISEVELTITEGKFHQVKRMFEAVGKKVIYLKRLSMGNLTLPKDLAPGEYRPLTKQELEHLRNIQHTK
ncbi:MAG: pseudouridine synthase [Clostridiales bacterium]|nr:pseudouridine synthase [Clostridiales bacterium]